MLWPWPPAPLFKTLGRFQATIDSGQAGQFVVRFYTRDGANAMCTHPSAHEALTMALTMYERPGAFEQARGK